MPSTRAVRALLAGVVLASVAGLGTVVGTAGTPAEGSAEPHTGGSEVLSTAAPQPTARPVTVSRAEPRVEAAPPALLPVRTVKGTTYRPRRTADGRPAKVTRPPTIKAYSWVVADLATGQVLATHRHRWRLPQASTIKLLTAVTASRTVPAKPSHKVTKAEAHPEHCSCAGLAVGARYTREALTAGMLLPSGNDAAEALAGSHPRGRAAFIAAMNALADDLGASDTHVVNPSGLNDKGAVSSARDLLLFLRAAEADPAVAPLLDRATYPFGRVGGPTRPIHRSTDYVNKYAKKHPGTRGKNGFTTPAQNTLVVTTPIRGRRIAVATLGAPGGWSTKGARGLTLWAARNYDQLAPVEPLPSPDG